jgi:hypothetical protein
MMTPVCQREDNGYDMDRAEERPSNDLERDIYLVGVDVENACA